MLELTILRTISVVWWDKEDRNKQEEWRGDDKMEIMNVGPGLMKKRVCVAVKRDTEPEWFLIFKF